MKYDETGSRSGQQGSLLVESYGGEARLKMTMTVLLSSGCFFSSSL